MDPLPQPSPNCWLERIDAAALEALTARRTVARHLAQVLAQDFGVRRVILFGSTARGETRGRGDIDLAVEGLSVDLELRAQGLLMLASRFPVDLVRLETASERLRAHIEHDGIVLHPSAGAQ